MDDLAAKIESWIERGVISVRTAKKILASEGINADDILQARSGRRVVAVISVLGSILIGIGIILLIGTNWQELDVLTKLSLIFVAILAAYGAGYYLQYFKSNYPKIGYSLILLGAILYGAGLFLVSQMFHTNANPDILFLLWGLGILPVAYFAGNEAVFSLSVITFGFWTFFESFGDGMFNIFFGGFMPNANYWFLAMFAVILMPIAIRLGFQKGYAFNILALLFWFGTAIASWFFDLAQTFGDAESLLVVALLYYIFLGSTLIFTGRIFNSFPALEKFGFINRFFGGAAIAIPVYILSFNEVLYFYRESVLLEGPSFFAFYGLVVIAVLLAVGTFFYSKSESEKRIVWRETGVLALLGIFTFIYFLFPVDFAGSSSYLYGRIDAFHPYVLPWNIALLALNIMMIVVGYFERRNFLVNIGILFFIIHVISRYLDSFALRFDTSFAFIIGGALLLALAVSLEKFRRSLIKKMAAAGAGEVSV